MNREALDFQFHKLKEAYDKALEAPVDNFSDLFPYRADETANYGLDFLAKIEACFVQDYLKNMEWYKDNYNLINLNVC